jgi:succinyl-CoA synthetase alpha subunit
MARAVRSRIFRNTCYDSVELMRIAAVAAADEEAAVSGLERVAALLSGAGGEEPAVCRTRTATALHEALAELPDANFVMVSTPGMYATAEALKALNRGLRAFGRGSR